MKAYMSETHTDDYGPHNLGGPCATCHGRNMRCGRSEYELERILAVTEAGSETPALGLRVWEPHTPLASALADALRAFVVSR